VRYRILAIGAASRDVAAAMDRYVTRLARHGEVEVIEVKGSKVHDAELARTKDAEALRSRADGYRVALDERGRRFDTAGLARHVSDLEQRGVSRITLMVGGAEGLDETVRKEVDETWRLSDLTLAHDLARLVLLEQLYRVESLRAGHPYHRAG